MGCAVVVIAAAAFATGPAVSDVRLTAQKDAGAPLTVALTAFDGVPPFDPKDGPGLDSGPSNGVVREGDPVTYVVDIAVGNVRLSDVVIELRVPRGFSVAPVPEYCGDGSRVTELGFGEFGLRCRVGELDAGRYLTRPMTMTVGEGLGVGAVSVVAVITAEDGAIRVRSGEVTVQISGPTDGCDPYGLPASARSATGDDARVVPDLDDAPPDRDRRNEIDSDDDVAQHDQNDQMPAEGRISGLVTDGVAQVVSIDGVDRCGHAIAREVTPFDGRFSFVGLMPGTYRLTVDGRAPVTIVLREGAMTLDGVTF
ncbi:hypothetical protein HG717_15955 [Rhodococcus erythropolis]|nr:hypothetical protein [Rhodococcus erythropolis]